MNLTVGDRLRRKSDGKVFTLTHLGSWAGPGGSRRPLFVGLQIRLVADDGEACQFRRGREVEEKFTKDVVR